MIANSRLDAANHRGTAAEGNDGNVRSARPVEHSAHAGFVIRKGDEVRRIGEVAGISPDSLRIRLAVGMKEPLVGLGAEHVRNRAGRRQMRLAQADVCDLRRNDGTRFDTKPIGKEAEQPIALRLIEARVLHAPAVEFQAGTHEITSLGPFTIYRWGSARFHFSEMLCPSLGSQA